MTSLPADTNLKLLRTFDAVARHCSFSRAADELGRSQATISAQIRDLEQQLGVRLLDRTTRRVALTEAGQALAVGTRAGFASIVKGVSTARDFADERRGRIIVACVPSLSGVRFPAILAAYRLRDSGTRIDIEELTSSEILTALAQGSVDFGIGPCIDPPPAGINFTLAVEEPLCVVLPRGHMAKVRGDMPLDALAALPLITLSGSVLLQTRLEELMRAHGLKLSSQTEVRHVQTAVGLAQAGVGAAVVPRLALPIILDCDVVALPISHPPLTRRVGIITRRGEALRPVASKLARHVRTALAKALQSIASG